VTGITSPVAKAVVGSGCMGQASLYERLGGVYAIGAVVDYFSDQLVERGTIEGRNPNIED
jgi:hypothetical protein